MTNYGTTLKGLAKNKLFWVHLVHILVVGPLVLYSGAYGLSKEALPTFLSLALMVIGALAILYHAYGLFKQITTYQ